MNSATRVGYRLYSSNSPNSAGRRRLIAALAAAVLFGAATSRGQAPPGDPPGRVALVNLLEGAGAIQPAGATQWLGDVVNRPLASGDKVWIDADSRAELHLGSTAIRLRADTGLQFLNIADDLSQLRLTAGSVDVRLRYLSPDESFEIDTPNSAILLLQSGEYRVDVDEDGTAVAVGVLRGEAQVAGATQSFTIEAGQRGRFRGSDQLGVDFGDLPAPDEFDAWAESRNQREDEALTANYVSRDVTGYESLDQYGTWENDPDTGAVWLPRVTADWVPYSAGHWIWLAPWGWTWIDDAPWGFAPFHYGRWIRGHHGWCWSPGGFSVHPIYAPALVAWIDGPDGGVGWVALGYNEIYRPPYRVSDRYLREVNVTNTNIGATASIPRVPGPVTHPFANQTIPGAVTAVPRAVFLGAKPVKHNRLALSPQTLATATATAAIAIAPTASSFAHSAPAGGGHGVAPDQSLFRRAVVARTAPPQQPGVAPEPRRVILTQTTAVPRPSGRARAADPLPTLPNAPAASSTRPAPPAFAGPARSDPPRATERPIPAAPERAAMAPRNDRPTVMPAPPAYPREDRPPPRSEPQRGVEPQRAVETPRTVETPRVMEAPRFEEATPAERPAMPAATKKEPAVAEPAVKRPETKPPKPEQH